MRPVLAHRLQGDRGDVVVLLNGGMMTYPSWAPIAGSLLGRYRVLGCDLRGQLQNPGPGHPRLIDNVGDVIALLDALGIGAAHVLGTSFGGEVGVLLAAEHPDRVLTLAAVTAVDRAPDTLGTDSRRLRDLARAVLAGGDANAFHDAVVESVYSPAYLAANPREVAARRARSLELPATWYEGLLGILASVEAFDLTPWLGRVHCPALVVHAANDRVMPAERVRALAAGIAGAELVVHPTSGHALVVEDPAWLARVYSGFLGSRGD